jgi:hypothetical protein
MVSVEPPGDDMAGGGPLQSGAEHGAGIDPRLRAKMPVFDGHQKLAQKRGYIIG